MSVITPARRIGYWVSEKKSRKLNFADFEKLCSKAGLKLVKIDLNIPLEDQGPFDVIIHKTTDIVGQSSQNPLARQQIQMFEKYVENHKEVIMIDPLQNVEKLLDRYKQYKLVMNSDLVKKESAVFMPHFVEFTSTDMTENLRIMKDGNVSFPIICKSSITHGYNFSHQMALIFNEKGLKDVHPPCVAQTFVNHNAVLYKIFMIGGEMHVVTRPSIKNLIAKDQDNIYFDSHDVSKSNSESFLNKLDEEDEGSVICSRPADGVLEHTARSIRSLLGMDLFGIDIILENHTGRCAIIDINVFPGYDGVPDFFNKLLNMILKKLCFREEETAIIDFNDSLLRNGERDLTNDNHGKELLSNTFNNHILKDDSTIPFPSK